VLGDMLDRRVQQLLLGALTAMTRLAEQLQARDTSNPV
jgi:hypothetical protein